MSAQIFGTDDWEAAERRRAERKAAAERKAYSGPIAAPRRLTLGEIMDAWQPPLGGDAA